MNGSKGIREGVGGICAAIHKNSCQAGGWEERSFQAGGSNRITASSSIWFHSKM